MQRAELDGTIGPGNLIKDLTKNLTIGIWLWATVILTSVDP